MNKGEIGWRARVRAAMDAKGFNMRSLSTAAGLGETFVRDMLERGRDPSVENFAKVCQALREPMDKIAGDDFKTSAITHASIPVTKPSSNVDAAESSVNLSSLPVDVPVYGVVVGGSGGDFRFSGEIVDYVRRPPGIANQKSVYALWVRGSSMSPWAEDGALIYVSPVQPSATGDYVVIQLQDESEGVPGVAMVKRLLGKTPTKVRLVQFNPQQDFDVALSKVKAIHKVLTMRELLIA